MISYSRIGHFGRLGNQLFQFASTFGIANKCGYDVAFPYENTIIPNVESFKDGLVRPVTFDIPKYFEVDVQKYVRPLSQIDASHRVQEKHFHFDEGMFRISDGADLGGYYQTEKYFEHCEKEIRQQLRFKFEIESKVHESTYKKLRYPATSVHIRLGDYVGLQEFHPIMEAEYYQNAMSYLNNSTSVFLVFSDNIEIAKQIFPEDDRVQFVEEGSDVEQMCLMSMCENNIIANSSFSWWAAWLNKSWSKKVIAPKNWFGPAYQGVHDTRDLYPKNWIVI